MTFSRCAALTLVLLCPVSCRTPDRLFAKLDLNQNARLSLPELERAVTDGFFRTYDSNGDGSVSLEEWRKKDPAGNRSFFRSRDTNRDGNVSRPEALATIRRLGQSYDFFSEMDRDGDGQLSEKETLVWISDHPEVLARLNITP